MLRFRWWFPWCRVLKNVSPYATLDTPVCSKASDSVQFALACSGGSGSADATSCAVEKKMMVPIGSSDKMGCNEVITGPLQLCLNVVQCTRLWDTALGCATYMPQRAPCAALHVSTNENGICFLGQRCFPGHNSQEVSACDYTLPPISHHGHHRQCRKEPRPLRTMLSHFQRDCALSAGRLDRNEDCNERTETRLQHLKNKYPSQSFRLHLNPS